MSVNITQHFQKDRVLPIVHVHKLRAVKAGHAVDHSWVTFKDDIGGEVTLHVDHHLADAIQEAFDDYENWLSGQEGPTFDEALGAKCDAVAAQDAARALK